MRCRSTRMSHATSGLDLPLQSVAEMQAARHIASISTLRRYTSIFRATKSTQLLLRNHKRISLNSFAAIIFRHQDKVKFLTMLFSYRIAITDQVTVWFLWMLSYVKRIVCIHSKIAWIFMRVRARAFVRAHVRVLRARACVCLCARALSCGFGHIFALVRALVLFVVIGCKYVSASKDNRLISHRFWIHVCVSQRYSASQAEAPKHQDLMLPSQSHDCRSYLRHDWK